MAVPLVQRSLKHDPEKWIPVRQRSCSNKMLKRNTESTSNHFALAGAPTLAVCHNVRQWLWISRRPLAAADHVAGDQCRL